VKCRVEPTRVSLPPQLFTNQSTRPLPRTLLPCAPPAHAHPNLFSRPRHPGLSLLFRWLRSSSRRPGALSAHPQKPRAKARTSGDRFAVAPGGAPAGSAPARATKAKSRAATVPGPEAVLALVRARAQGEWVTARLRVLKVLADDHEGSRHQRLLVKVGQDPRGNDFTVKVSHNIDLAPRVPSARAMSSPSEASSSGTTSAAPFTGPITTPKGGTRAAGSNTAARPIADLDPRSRRAHAAPCLALTSIAARARSGEALDSQFRRFWNDRTVTPSR
jgi:hypothetical protein